MVRKREKNPVREDRTTPVIRFLTTRPPSRPCRCQKREVTYEKSTLHFRPPVELRDPGNPGVRTRRTRHHRVLPENERRQAKSQAPVRSGCRRGSVSHEGGWPPWSSPPFLEPTPELEHELSSSQRVQVQVQLQVQGRAALPADLLQRPADECLDAHGLHGSGFYEQRLFAPALSGA